MTRIITKKISRGGLPPIEVSLAITDGKVEASRVVDVSNRPIDGKEYYMPWMSHETYDDLVREVANEFGIRYDDDDE